MPRFEKPLSVFEAISQRRAVRSFTPEQVDEATVSKLIDAAVQAPTAIHLEPWAFVVIQDPALLRGISDRAKTMWPRHAPSSTHLHRDAAVPAASKFARMLADPEFNIFYNAGTLIVICGRPMGPFVTADCWLAAENLMLAASGMGLGTCVIGSAAGALNTPELKAELGIPADVTAIAPIIVGVPEELPPPTGRKAPEILSWRKPRI